MCIPWDLWHFGQELFLINLIEGNIIISACELIYRKYLQNSQF